MVAIQQDKWAPETKAIKDRAREARRWLKARPEKEIVLVTHGGFLHYFTEDWEDSSVYQGMNYSYPCQHWQSPASFGNPI